MSNPTLVELRLFWGCLGVVLWLSCGFDNILTDSLKMRGKTGHTTHLEITRPSKKRRSCVDTNLANLEARSQKREWESHGREEK